MRRLVSAGLNDVTVRPKTKEEILLGKEILRMLKEMEP